MVWRASPWAEAHGYQQASLRDAEADSWSEEHCPCNCSGRCIDGNGLGLYFWRQPLRNQTTRIVMNTRRISFAPAMALMWTLAQPAKGASDLVNGNLIQFNDNGAWTWFSDPRVMVDSAGGKMVVGVDVSGVGYGGSSRDGAVEAPMFDLRSGISTRTTLMASGTLGP